MTRFAELAINDANIADISYFFNTYDYAQHRELVTISTQAAVSSIEGLDEYRAESEASKDITELILEVDESIAVIEGLIETYGIRRGES